MGRMGLAVPPLRGLGRAGAALIVLGLYLSTACALIDDYDYGETVLIDYDFETGSLLPWEGQYRADGTSFAFSVAAPHAGKYCGQFSLGPGGDYWVSPNTGMSTARSEIQLKGTAPANVELYYSWYVKIDQDYVESSDWQLIGQFHDQPDPAMGESWSLYPANSPPLAYKYRNGQLVVCVYSWDTLHAMDLLVTPLSKGQWHRITTRVFWSVKADGFMESWLDGQKLVAANGQDRYLARNCYNNAGNYLKIGLYRSSSIQTAGTVYFDSVRSGPSPASIGF